MDAALEGRNRQNPEILEKLIATSDAELLEHTKNDHYWADGGDGSGKNMLGKILMETRVALSLDDGSIN